MEDFKIKIAGFIWKLPSRMGFSRDSKFKQLTMLIVYKLVNKKNK